MLRKKFSISPTTNNSVVPQHQQRRVHSSCKHKLIKVPSLKEADLRRRKKKKKEKVLTMRSTNEETELQDQLAPEKSLEQSSQSARTQVKVYRRRWLIITLYIVFAATNTMQWFKFTIISNIITRYYAIDKQLLNWTAMFPMVIYTVLLFPGSYLMDRIGLRRTILLGCAVNILGAWIKVLGVENDKFFVVFVGQAVASSAVICVLTIPARLASYWFGAKQVGFATALACFGIQFGIAFCFLITPTVIKNHENLDDVHNEMQLFHRCIAIACSCIGVAVFFLFKDEPKLPPSESRALQKKNRDESKGFWQPVISVLTNKNFLLLFIAFGFSAGTLNGVSTLLNPLYLNHFENGEEDAGRIGLLLVFSGTFGSILFGIALDKTKKFKEIMVILYFCGVIAQLFFATTLYLEIKWMTYISGMILGMFLVGYTTTCYQICAEITYPEPEVISTGILNIASQTFGIFLVSIIGRLMEVYSDIIAHVCFIVVLIIGFFLSLAIKKENRRQDALNNVEYSAVRGQK